MALKPYDGDFEPLEAGQPGATKTLKPYEGDFTPLGEAPASGVADTLWEGTKSAGRAIGATVDAYTGDNQGIAEKAQAQQVAPKDSRVEKFQQDFAQRTEALGEDPGVLDTIGEGLGAVWDNPAGAGLAVVEQLPNAVPTLAGGFAGMKAGAAAGAAVGAPFAGVGAGPGAAIGGVVGGLAGMFLGNAAIETGHKAMGMADDGVVTDEERGQAIEEGAVKGAVITGVDALTLGAGGKVAGALQRTTSRAMESATRKALVDRGVDVADEAAVLAARSNPEIATAVRAAQENARAATDKLGKRMATGGALLGMETVGEGVGEYLGEMAATGEGNVPDAVLESLLSLGQSGAETAWNLSRTKAQPDALVQPTPTAENPNPAPVERPDPSAGPLSAAANLLPAPSIAGALPAPDTLYGDAAGNVNATGPNINVDGAVQPAQRGQAWVNPQNNPAALGGAGMDRQVERGAEAPLQGDLIRGAGQARSQAEQRQPVTIDGQVEPAAPGRIGSRPVVKLLADQRQTGFAADSQGNVQAQRFPNQPPADYVQGGRGMDQQTPVGKRYGNVLAAKNAIQKAGGQATMEAVKVGDKDFEVQAKVEAKPVLQNRDRSTPASVTQMREIAARPDYSRLGFSRDFANGAPVVEPGALVPKARLGRQDVATTASGRQIPVQYAAVEAAALMPSHDVNGTPVADYASGMPAKSRAIAGNGRIAGLRHAFTQRTAGVYVEQFAADDLHGISPVAIRAMKEPVLVRIMPLDEITQDIGDESNTVGVSALSGAEQATNDARRVDIDALVFSESGDISDATLRQFVQAMPKAEQGGLLDGMRPSRQAHDRAASAIFASAYESDTLIRLQAQSTDPEVRTVLSGLLVAAPKMAKLKGLGQWDIRGLLVEAAEAAVNARRNGQALTNYAAQADMDRSPEAQFFIDLFAGNIRSAKRIGEELSNLADLFYSEASKPDTDMFGSVPKRGRQELLGESNGTAEGESGSTQSAGEQAGAGADAPGVQGRETERAEPAGAAAAAQPETLQLNSYTEDELAAQASAQAAADAAAAAQQKAATDKAQADRDRNDFTLSGSDRPADVAASRGQNDMFDAGTQRALESAAHEAATSPRNDLPEPTEAQKEAGNYRKGHVTVQGLDLTIENPRGSDRTGKREDGSEWRHTMSDHYGYIKRTEGADGEHVDIYLGKSPESERVFVVDQLDQQTGGFDEHKVMLGFTNKIQAVAAYRSNFDAGWKVGPVSTLTMDQFKEWLKDGDLAEPAAQAQQQAGQKEKIQDFGEKIGGARKDLAVSTGSRPARASDGDTRPAWARRFEISQVVSSTNTAEVGRWEVRDNRLKDWMKQPKKVGSYATREEAERAVPLIAVAQKHRVVSQRQGDGDGFEIWRTISDRKRVKVVDQVFPSREAAMEYMATNAQQIVETNTTFGEADLPRPENTQRIGAARREGSVKDRAFIDTFGFRGVEFGNWNNQEERQQLLDDAYDGLLDLAEVMGIPPKAISLNGELALAFGARGHGLSGARAHYEPSKAAINLTKMNGAGSLAHEWFHALDHYFGRQDGKASAEWVIDEDGTRSLKTSDSFEREAVSSGFRRSGSGVRAEVRQAYTELMKTMTVKAEQYVEDTARVDGFVARARKEVSDRLDRLRADLAEQKDPKYWKRHNKPASAEQLASFDTVAQQILDGVQLETELRSTKPDAPVRRRNAFSGMRWTNDALEQISTIYKAVRGRSGFNADNNGELDRLRGVMSGYSSRLKMLADAQGGAEKTKQVPTQFAMDAKELDQGRGTDYWTTPHEMAARAFQGYVEDQIAERGGSSPFLNYGPAGAVIPTPWGWKRPFPIGAERKAINQSFDNLVETIQVREGDDGNVAMYSRASYRRASTPGQGLQAGQLRLQLKRLTGGWQSAPEIKVVQSIKDLPDAQRRQVERDGAFDVEGMFADGQVYLVADNLRDVKHAAFVLQHEVLGHAGLQGAYGQRLTPLLMSLYSGNAQLRQQADELVARYGYKPAVAMEEVLADMAAAGTLQQQPFWSRLVTAMRNALRSIGIGLSWSEGDIQALLANARRYIVNGRARPGARAAFSRDGRSGYGPELADEQGRLLAPNGKPSKLNQKQWHQVRSESFDRWFGDWQALAVERRLEKVAPLRLKTPEAWKGLGIKERQGKVLEMLRGLVAAGESLQHDVLGEVKLYNGGAKKATSTSADPAKHAVLARVQDAIRRAEYSRWDFDSKGREGMAHHKLVMPVTVDGVPLYVVFNVREDGNGRRLHNLVTLDRKEEALAVSPGEMTREGQRSAPANTKASAEFVRRPLTRVNPDTVSKVTDGSGEPMVLYHGTGEEFSVFEQGRAGRSTGHSTAPLGIFMTSDREVAKAYAEKAADGMPGLANVMPLFVSIKKPYRMSMAESQALDTTEAAIAYRQKLEREGYDGIQLGDTGVWVAFYNTQVKSATNNTGAFDEIDPDVRYRRAGQADTVEAAEVLRKLGLGAKGTAGLRQRIQELAESDLRAKLKEWAGRSEEGIFDGLAGIKRAEESVGVTSPDQQGYVSARMASGIADVMHGVLHYAAPEWRDGVVSGKAGTRGVLEILGDLGQDNLTPWLAWLGGKRGQLLKAQGRENNLTDADIAELLAMGKGKEALFEKVYREYAQVNEAVLDLAQGAGLIDQDARAKWLTDYYVPFYRQDEAEGMFSAPRSKRGLSHQTAAIKALKGGTLPTNDLLANMLAGWTKRIDASMKNKALLEVVENLKGSNFLADESPRWQQVLISRDQIAQQIRKDRKALALAAQMLDMPADAKLLQVLNKLQKPESEGFEQLWTRVAPTDPDIIRVQRDGKSEYYRVNDDGLLRGLKFIEGSVFNDPITKIGRAFKRLLTTGVTASPDFILRNFIRDAAHAWMINKDGFTLGKDSIKGMRDALREDQDYRDLMFAGGSFQGGYVHGADPEASAQIIRRALEKKGFTRKQQDQYLGSLVNTPAKAASMLKQGWEKYRTLGDKVENANRLSTYKAARGAGKSRRQASFEAKDLMDYSLRGNFAAAQWFTDVVPFLNARLQGLYKLGRAVKGDKTLLAKEVAMKGGYIALFSLLLAGINDDDERYQALQDWDKDMHWHIFLGDQHFRIPKPFELGLVFGTVPERLLHAATGSQDGGDLAKAVAQGVFQTLAFNPVPQFYQPIRELQANRNFFRDSPIEDMSDEGKLPEARYDARTSALGYGVGQVTGPLLGLSPKQVDHLVQGYTGTLGGYVLAMSSLIAAGLTPGDRPSARAADLPVAKVIYQGSAVTSSKYQSEFYDMMREADQLQRTLNSYRDEGKVEAAAQLYESSRDKLRHRPALGLARRQLGNIRTQMDAIYRDESMDGDVKRERLDNLQRRSNEIAKRITERAGEDF